MGARPFHLSVALDGTGFHPASWRDPSARPTELFGPDYWIELGRTAERGLLDFVTIEDSFGLQSSRSDGADGRVDQVRGRLDAVQIASLIGPVTRHVGLVPTAITTHTEPFHLASALSTLDYVSRGRGGWRPQVSVRQSDADHVGRRSVPKFNPDRIDDPQAHALIVDLFDEATDSVDVVRRLWDSWEDDAIIKHRETGRYIDRDKLHYVDFAGRFFSVKGPSIVPRPPQGQPVVAALAHSQVPFEFAARAADIVFVTPADRAAVPEWIAQVRGAETVVGRSGRPLLIHADLVVVLDADHATAERRKHRLDAWDGAPLRTDAAVFVGTPEELTNELTAWHALGLDGFRLRPAVIGHDLDEIVDEVVPALQRRGLFRTAYEPGL
ncbi:MAG TPA: LLM class flavin-dependent oxidoreductase, partial [Ilumatobacteraceae bacterium]|nr:LLM class flavin-dependent oxidoreductase [Ilumatobacteraceae bacterium]